LSKSSKVEETKETTNNEPLDQALGMTIKSITNTGELVLKLNYSAELSNLS